VLKDQVVELVLEYSTNLIFWQAGTELRVVNHFELSSLGTDPNTRSRNASILTLFNLAAKCSEERLVHEQAVGM
jgi:hypothetical protein